MHRDGNPGRRGLFRETALPWMPETGRAIFKVYRLRAAGTGGALGRAPIVSLPEGEIEASHERHNQAALA